MTEGSPKTGRDARMQIAGHSKPRRKKVEKEKREEKANPQLGFWVQAGSGFGIGKSFALCLRLAPSSPFLFVSEILFA